MWSKVQLKQAWSNWTGLSVSTLKLIALATMLIDHIAAAVLVRYFLAGQYRNCWNLYIVMRCIGRIAFPIYCYMLVEGLKYTSNKWKYLMRTGAFAVISEVPFDLAFQSSVAAWNYQNVYMTLFFGLSMLILLDITETNSRKWFAHLSAPEAEGVTKIICILIAVLCMMGAYLCRTDYGWAGVLCIFLFYITRGNKWLQLASGYLAFGFLLEEWVALPAFLLLALYKGKKGFTCKPLFYGFYPVHLIALYYVCVILQIAQYSAL